MKTVLLFLSTLYVIYDRLSSGINTGQMDEGLAALYDDLCPHNSKCAGVQGEGEQLPDGQEPCCKACSCLDHCVLLNNCCPDKANLTADAQTSSSSVAGGISKNLSADMFSCRADTRKKNVKFNRIADYYFMVDKCPVKRKYDGKTLQCERESRSYYASSVPVIDEASQIIYANKYCAECHNVYNTTEWLEELKCGQTLLSSWVRGPHFPDTYNDMLSSRLCEHRYISPVSVESSRCIRRSTYSWCNLTGLWKTYLEPVEEACSKYNVPFLITYKNAFCALCNGHNFSTDQCSISLNDPYMNSFTAILIPNSDRESSGEDHADSGWQHGESMHCKSGQMFDPYHNICREVFCPRRKTMIEGKCVTLMQIQSAVMHVAVKLMTESDFFKSAFTDTKVKLARDYLKFFSRDRYDVSVLLRDVAETPKTFSESPYLVIIIQVKATNVPDDDILDWINERLKTDFTFKWFTDRNITFQISVHNTIDISYFRMDFLSFDNKTYLSDLSTNTSLITLYHRVISSYDTNVYVGILVTKLLFCRQVRLSEGEFLKRGRLIVIRASNMTMYRGEYVRFVKHGEVVQICESDYVSVASSFHRPQESSSSFKWRHIVLTVITVLCVVIVCAGSVLYCVCVKRNFHEQACPCRSG